MAWLGTLLLLLLLGCGAVALARYRKTLRDDSEPAGIEVPPEVLIARARAHEAALRARSDDTDPG
jgi:hypothetical protein